MFYCDPCGEERGWPTEKTNPVMAFTFKSRGPCEMCHKVAVCNDVPSKYLPPSKGK